MQRNTAHTSSRAGETALPGVRIGPLCHPRFNKFLDGNDFILNRFNAGNEIRTRASFRIPALKAGALDRSAIPALLKLEAKLVLKCFCEIAKLSMIFEKEQQYQRITAEIPELRRLARFFS